MGELYLKIKLVLQHDYFDCGAACVSMISSYYGLYRPLQFFRKIVGTTKNGTTVFNMTEGIQKIGCNAEALMGDFSDLLKAKKDGEITFPCIIHLKNNHFVVLSSLSDKNVTIYDPQYGKYKLTIEDFKQKWSGYLINCVPNATFNKGNYVISPFERLKMILKKQWLRLFLAFVISACIYILGIILSFSFEMLLDNESEHMIQNVEEPYLHNNSCTCDECEHINQSSDVASLDILFSSKSLTLSFAILLGMVVVASILSYIRGRIVLSLSKKIDLETTLSYYKKILKIPIKDKELRKNGDYLSRFSDSYQIRYAISDATITILIDIFMVLVGFFILIQINSNLLYFSMVMIFIYAIVVLIYRRRLEYANKISLVKNAEMHSYFKEVLEGYDAVKYFCSEEEVKKKGTDKYNMMIEKYYARGKMGLRESALLYFVELMGRISVIVIGISLIAKGEMTVGAFVSFSNILSFFTEPIKSIVMFQPTIQSAIISLDRIYDIFDIEIEKMTKKQVVFANGDIKYSHVDFAYESNIPVLQDFSAVIRQGSFTGIKGKSGSGKSSLMKLLTGTETCQNGSISINNIDISLFSAQELRRHILYLNQNGFIFENTILYNLKWEDLETPDDNIRNVCRLCCIEDYIEKLPLKYNTLIGENGNTLSQGQRQRINLARALLQSPDILILDEALSNVDLDDCRIILDNIKKYRKNKTLVFISHSNDIMDLCDTIITI